MRMKREKRFGYRLKSAEHFERNIQGIEKGGKKGQPAFEKNAFVRTVMEEWE
jgi:hypothetical protein